MSMQRATATSSEDDAQLRSRTGLVRSVLRQRQGAVGATIVAVFVVVAVFAPLLQPYDPLVKTGPVFAPPSRAHPLGTEGGGLDVLSLLIAGSRVSLLVGFVAALVVALVGGGIGLLAGYFGGKTDTVLMRVTDYVLVIPDLPLMVVVAGLFGRSLVNVILIIGAIYWTWTARIIRAQVKSVRERTYVRRARSIGGGDLHIMTRHVLPQIAPLLVANTVLFISFAIFVETFMAFLGLGDPSLISWGRLIQDAYTSDAVLNGAWWVVVPPGVSVAVVVLATTVVGQSMESVLNPRLRVGHLAVRHFRLRHEWRQDA